MDCIIGCRQSEIKSVKEIFRFAVMHGKIWRHVMSGQNAETGEITGEIILKQKLPL